MSQASKAIACYQRQRQQYHPIRAPPLFRYPVFYFLFYFDLYSFSLHFETASSWSRRKETRGRKPKIVLFAARRRCASRTAPPSIGFLFSIRRQAPSTSISLSIPSCRSNSTTINQTAPDTSASKHHPIDRSEGYHFSLISFASGLWWRRFCFGRDSLMACRSRLDTENQAGRNDRRL